MVEFNGNGHYNPVPKALYAEREVHHQPGFEVDHTQDGLRTVLNAHGSRNFSS